MSKYGAGGLTTAGSTTLPIFAIVGAATVVPRIREIGIFNTTVTAVALKLARLTGAGTPGTNLAESSLNGSDPQTALCNVWGTYTGTAPTLGADLGFRTVLGAAIGSGVIWTFEDWELTIPAVAAAAVAVIVENGTGQACQVYCKWWE